MADRVRVVATGARYVFGDTEQKMLAVFDAQYDKFITHSTWADDMDTDCESRAVWAEVSDSDYYELRGMYHMMQQVIPNCPTYAELTCSDWED